MEISLTIASSTCMINHVARSALSHHFIFLHVLQKAAASAYIRVQCRNSRTDALVTGLGNNASSREGFNPILVSRPRCAFSRMTVFSVLTVDIQESQIWFPSTILEQFTTATSTLAALLVTSPTKICSSLPCL